MHAYVCERGGGTEESIHIDVQVRKKERVDAVYVRAAPCAFATTTLAAVYTYAWLFVYPPHDVHTYGRRAARTRGPDAMPSPRLGCVALGRNGSSHSVSAECADPWDG